MNARLYDPVVGRFLSPDPYVQAPDVLQNFNRYSYCLNNPLVFTDPSGEKWWHWLVGGLIGGDIFIGGGLISSTAAIMTGTAFNTVPVIANTLSAVDFTSIWLQSFSNSGEAGRRFDNWLKMEFQPFNSILGTFRYDQSANWVEWPLQVLHNLTGGEFLQDYLGNGLGHYLNISGKVDASGYYQGRLVMRTDDNTLNNAISLGHYVLGDNIALNPDDSKGHDLDLLAHEFGHTYQSRIMGPLYLFRIGLASVINNNGSIESDATRRGSFNLDITIENTKRFPSGTSTYKWYEFLGAPVLWPFMWMWNID
jgi:hypothetical protein